MPARNMGVKKNAPSIRSYLLILNIFLALGVFILAGTSVTTFATVSNQTGSLSVASSPSSAKLYIYGIYRGMTPIKVDNLRQGNYTVKLIKTGYKNYTSTVSVFAGRTTTLKIVLYTSAAKEY